MNEPTFQFEWDAVKAEANERKHGITFDLASSIFHDPNLLTVADLKHSDIEERWFSIGIGRNGVMLSVAYLWIDSGEGAIKIRLISARESTRTEARKYEEG